VVIFQIHGIRERQLCEVPCREKSNFLEHTGESAGRHNTAREAKDTDLVGAIREQHHPYDYSTTCVLDGGRLTRGSPAQCWVWTAIGHPSVSLVQNPKVKVTTTLEDDGLQHPPPVYLEASVKRTILVKFEQWGLT